MGLIIMTDVCQWAVVFPAAFLWRIRPSNLVDSIWLVPVIYWNISCWIIRNMWQQIEYIFSIGRILKYSYQSIQDFSTFKYNDITRGRGGFSYDGDTPPPQGYSLKAKNQLFQLKHSKKTTLPLQSIIDLYIFYFACQVIVSERSFLRRMIGLTCGLSKPHHHIQLNKKARTDSEAWLGFLHNFNGRTILQQQRWTSSVKLHMYTDSAASIGYAGVLDTEWFSGKWPQDWKVFSIVFLEFFRIITVLDLSCERLANNRLNIIIVKLNFPPKNKALTVILNMFLILTDEKIFLLYYFYSHGLCNQRHNNNSPFL